jgi:hypothetical protein
MNRLSITLLFVGIIGQYLVGCDMIDNTAANSTIIGQLINTSITDYRLIIDESISLHNVDPTAAAKSNLNGSASLTSTAANSSSTAVDFNAMENRNTSQLQNITINLRFNNSFISIKENIPVKEKELTVLISITSGPGAGHLRNAARETWLLPCRYSAVCDYRFFVDKIVSNETLYLSEESEAHKDMVFRGNWCAFYHERHHEKVNYGNVFYNWKDGRDGVPYYQLRGLYRIDWKVCFTKWAKLNDKMALYHVYVEDDSYVCTENLIHQTTLLKHVPVEKKLLPFRTGTLMRVQGFDDSSTFMGREVGHYFYYRFYYHCYHYHYYYDYSYYYHY